MDEYSELLAKHKPKPINGDEDYRRTLLSFDELSALESPTESQQLIREHLGILIADHQSRVLYRSPAEKIAEMMKYNQISLGRLAEETQISPDRIEAIQKGIVGFTDEEATAIAKALGLSLAVLYSS